MPREELTQSIRKAVKLKGYQDEVSERIIAYVKRAEESEFPNRDREEQLNLIFNKLPSFDASSQADSRDS
jgi:hypothetical protein